MSQWILRISLGISSFLFFLTAYTQTLYPWMHSDIQDAWKQGYQGQGVTIQVVDDFYGDKLPGKLSDKYEALTHGEWTSKQAGMIAPAATIKNIDKLSLLSSPGLISDHGLNIFNFSAIIFDHDNKNSPSLIELGEPVIREENGRTMISFIDKSSDLKYKPYKPIIDLAKDGRVIISKAVGNDGVTMTSKYIDKLSLELKGTPSTIFVGALDTHGTTLAPATMASYSNTAGTDVIFQKNFLVVGIDAKADRLTSLIHSFLGFERKTGLEGTSFAAPTISSYAAILYSKFPRALPTEIVDQLLNTARQDTIKNYRPDIHGRGEASLSRALAPVSIQ